MYDSDKRFLRNSAIVLAIGIPFVMAGCSCGNRLHYSDGNRVGTITKFSHKGVLVKSWEGEMALGGFRSGRNGSAVANLWQFTVTDPAVVRDVLATQDKGGAARLHYVQTLTYNPLVRDSSYTVVKAEAVQE